MNTSDILAAMRQQNESGLREIAKATGLPVATLAKLRYGVTTDPRCSTVDKLRAHFEAPRLSKRAKPVPAAEQG